MRAPRVFSIQAGAPFLPTLADALIEGQLIGDYAAALADVTIYVPTRRAARALALLLAERDGGRATLLPRIVPLGETDDAEFELAAEFGEADALSALAPSVSPLERRLIFARLVQRWAGEVDRALLRLDPDVPFLVPASPADALALAADLETLMDGFTLENVPWEALAGAVEADYSEYFRLTLDFVRIAHDAWPAILAERSLSDPVRRRTLLVRAEAARLMEKKPLNPVIAAGSTGSIPATASLLAAIARLPNGAVVLPGLDMDLDKESFDAIGSVAETDADSIHGHPQAILRRLLTSHLQIPRDDVTALGTGDSAAMARVKFLSEILRPAATTDAWAGLGAKTRTDLASKAMQGLAIIEAADEREEALAAAVALRETLSEPGRTAMLVTPDRGLAARVRTELERWGISVDDSAGTALSDTGFGILARLAADAAASDFEPRHVLALLNHSLVRLGLSREAAMRAIRIVELGVLRGPAPSLGWDGLLLAFETRRADISYRDPRPLRRLTESDWALAADFLERLKNAFAGFCSEEWLEEDDLVRVAEGHRRTVEILATGEDGNLLADDDNSADGLAALFDDLALAEAGPVRGRFADYPSFFLELSRQRMLHPPQTATHRRLKILGLLEARLLHADRVVLGGLDEGVWPPGVKTDAFLNRPMRAAIGLAPPERRIGQTAHDFVQLAAQPDVVMTRALKRSGAPSIPARFLQRMKAFSGEGLWREAVERGGRYLRFAARLDERPPAPALARPAPKSDPALFPNSLSVTEIETLVRDPYAIYARHILKLDPLDPVAQAMGASDRGILIHEILGRFAAQFPDEHLPADPLPHLKAIADEAFAPVQKAYPDLYADWRARFERLAGPYIEWERERRPGVARILSEQSGHVPLVLSGDKVFTVRGRADRIEIRRDGTAAIVDFKTGEVPGVKEVVIGFSPQVTLEAAMLMAGAFKECPAVRETPELLYVQVGGGKTPLKLRPIEPPKGEERSIAEIVAEHWRRMEAKIQRFAKGEETFRSRPFPKYARRFSPYDHLARVKEWSLGGDGEDEE